MSKLSPVSVASVAVVPKEVSKRISLLTVKRIPMSNVANLPRFERHYDIDYIEYTHPNFSKIYDLLREDNNGEPVYFELSPYYGMPLGNWKCPTSPWERCVYFDDVDPAHDFCLYCGSPEERK
jgi:hypothetical protein